VQLPYHWGSPDPAERTKRQVEPTSRERRDERLARALRDQIYAGRLAPGDALPSTDNVAAEQGISTAMAQRAFEMLSREGLVRSEQGRGTYVCDRRSYEAAVTADASGRPPTARMLSDAEAAEPAVTGLAVSDQEGQRTWVMTVEAADVIPAAAVAATVARAAGAPHMIGVSVKPG
jgi:DNA-binding GntR family transcriptional regulator